MALCSRILFSVGTFHQADKLSVLMRFLNTISFNSGARSHERQGTWSQAKFLQRSLGPGMIQLNLGMITHLRHFTTRAHIWQ